MDIYLWFASSPSSGSQMPVLLSLSFLAIDLAVFPIFTIDLLNIDNDLSFLDR